MTTDETTVIETEPAAAAPKPEKPTLEALLAQYVDLRKARDDKTISAEDFDLGGRILRRKIRAAGGSVNTLRPESVPADPNAPKVEKKVRTKKVKGANVEAGLGGDPKAQPAGLAHVNWLTRILLGEEKLAEDPQIQVLRERSVSELEASGDYGMGIDVLTDVTARAVVERFIERFGYQPTWFCMHKPDSYEIPTSLTLLILGPAPGVDMASTAPVASESEVPADDEDAVEVEDGDEESDPDWEDPETE